MKHDHMIISNERQSITITSDHYATAAMIADFFLSSDHAFEVGLEIPLFWYAPNYNATMMDAQGRELLFIPTNKTAMLEMDALIGRFVKFHKPSGRVTSLPYRALQLAAVEISRRVKCEWVGEA